ncbi:MAG: DEAD/DEAH box helicase [Kordiimonadaceae bacterium]|nr:DEAD/DEAH box helicase [Kordiimonadaceae bacterium]
MIQLRDYQQGCSDALLNNMLGGNDGGLGVMATGTGKAFTLCDVIRRAIQDVQPDTRIIQLVHTKELVQQNFTSMIKLWPSSPAGIYSAGLGRKDARSQIIFGGIQSLYNKSREIGEANIVLVDEAQGMSRDANSMYGELLGDLRARNPKMKLCGLTATPYRMKCGMLHKGKDAMFKDIVYDYGIGQAVAEGYLVSPRTKQTNLTLNIDGVGKRGGEFIAGQLETAVDIDSTTKAAITETIDYAGIHNLGSWIVFGAGIKHCNSIRDELRTQGIAAEMVTSKTSPKERDLIFQAFKSGKVKALVNMNVATVGFDNPNVDLVVSLRPTGSAGLWLQMVGRGCRLIDFRIGMLPTIEQRLQAIANSSKPFFHVLDFAGNTSRHGPIDMINAEDKRTDGKGEAPIRVCEKCYEICFAGLRTCPNCGEDFPEIELAITQSATKEALLSSQREPDWRQVTQIKYEDYTSRAGKRSLKVTYYCGLGVNFSEYISPAWNRCRMWWFDRSNNSIIPDDLDEVLIKAPTLNIPTQIKVEKQGKYWQVLNHCFMPSDHTPEALPMLDKDKPNVAHFIDDDFEIPY